MKERQDAQMDETGEEQEELGGHGKQGTVSQGILVHDDLWSWYSVEPVALIWLNCALQWKVIPFHRSMRSDPLPGK